MKDKLNALKNAVEIWKSYNKTAEDEMNLFREMLRSILPSGDYYVGDGIRIWVREYNSRAGIERSEIPLTPEELTAEMPVILNDLIEHFENRLHKTVWAIEVFRGLK